MTHLSGKSTKGQDRVIRCEKIGTDYVLWIASEVDGKMEPGHSIYLNPGKITDPAIRLALEVLCR